MTMAIRHALLFVALSGPFFHSVVSRADEETSSAARRVIDNVIAGARPRPSDLTLVTAQIADPQDKIEFQRFVKGWRFDKNLVFSIEPWHLKVYRNRKLVFHSAWISLSPQALWINGKVLTSDSKDPSFFRRINKLLNQQNSKTANRDFGGRSPLYTSAIASALAADTASDFKTVLFALGLGDQLRSAEDLAKRHQSSPLEQAMFKFDGMGRQFYCTSDGVQAASFIFDGRKVTLKPAGSGKFEVQGLGDDGRLTASLKSPNDESLSSEVSSKDSAKTCAYDAMVAPNPGACRIFWDQFINNNPSYPHAANTSFRDYSCHTAQDPAACAIFIHEKQIEFDLKNHVYSSSVTFDRCTSADCKDHQELNYSDIGYALKTDSQSTDSAAPPAVKKGAALADSIAEHAMGLMILGECCKTESCRDTLKQERGIQLSPTGTNAVQ